MLVFGASMSRADWQFVCVVARTRAIADQLVLVSLARTTSTRTLDAVASMSQPSPSRAEGI